MSYRVLSQPEAVHAQAHGRGGAKEPFDVTAYDRSPPSVDPRRAHLAPENVAKANRKMNDYLTFFCQNAARDKEG